MAFIEFFGSFFAVGCAFLFGCLTVDCDFVLDVFDGLVDLCWPCGREEVDFLELVNCLDVVREVLLFLSFLFGWLLVLGLLFLI